MKPSSLIDLESRGGRLGASNTHADLPDPTPNRQVRRLGRLRRALAIAGPGIVVMLADTDAGSIITAAQSGAQWGYRLLLLQLVLIPVLYLVQELTVRLGAVTGQGHAHLIARHFGRGWAWISVATLVAACLGALLTELSGLAGVGLLYGIPSGATLSAVVVALVAMALTGSYRTVERTAMAVGAFEFVFVIVAWLSDPGLAPMARQAIELPLSEPSYMYLIAANIGAVIMPWMVFYQQSAVVEKGLTPADLRAARLDTAIGAVVTQVIMAAVLVTTATVLHQPGAGVALDTVQQIANALVPALGEHAGRLCFALGVVGSALVATIVVTLTAARTLGELLGYGHSLEQSPRETPWFYGAYTLILAVGAGVVASGVNLVSLSVGVQVMNALLLPTVLGFLYLLARRLPKPYRLKGNYSIMVGSVIAVTVVLGVYAGLAGLLQ